MFKNAEAQRPASAEDHVVVACPKCGGDFVVELQGQALDGRLRVACDHCGVEKPLKAFLREFERRRRLEVLQDQAEALQRRAEVAARQRSADEAKAVRLANVVVPECPGPDAESIPASSTNRQIRFEGKLTPSLSLLTGERILDVYEADYWDLGFVGALLGYKRRIMLTDQRVIYFDKGILSNVLQILFLRRVQTVRVAQEPRKWLLLIAAFLALSAILEHLVAATFTFSRDWVATLRSWLLLNYLFFFKMGVALVLVILSWRKTLSVSSGTDKISMKLARVNREESQRFVDKIFVVLNQNFA